jgi:YbgC/YbaW family acyl-CoA thioester hydrolase
MSTPAVVDLEARSYELDPYGHVNNAVYVNWLEHGRSAYLRERGLSWISIPGKFGVRVVIVSLDIEFRAEVGLNDELRITTSIRKTGNSSFTFDQEIVFADGRPVAGAEAVMVCTKDGAATPIPDGLRERLER